jgi:hypothetical protein
MIPRFYVQSDDSLLSRRLNFPRPRRSITSLIEIPRLSASCCAPIHPSWVTAIDRVFLGSPYLGVVPLAKLARDRSFIFLAIHSTLANIPVDLSLIQMLYRFVSLPCKLRATIHAPHGIPIWLEDHPLSYRKDHHIYFSAFHFHTGSGITRYSTFGGSICRRKSFKSRAPPTTRISTIPK